MPDLVVGFTKVNLCDDILAFVPEEDEEIDFLNVPFAATDDMDFRGCC